MSKEIKKEQPKKVEEVKKEEPKQQQDIYGIPCINLKLSVRQLNELRSALMCKIASYQINLETSFIPHEINNIKTNIEVLTNMVKDLNNVLNQAVAQLNSKPSFSSSIDQVKKSN